MNQSLKIIVSLFSPNSSSFLSSLHSENVGHFNIPQKLYKLGSIVPINIIPLDIQRAEYKDIVSTCFGCLTGMEWQLFLGTSLQTSRGTYSKMNKIQSSFLQTVIKCFSSIDFHCHYSVLPL